MPLTNLQPNQNTPKLTPPMMKPSLLNPKPSTLDKIKTIR